MHMCIKFELDATYDIPDIEAKVKMLADELTRRTSAINKPEMICNLAKI